MALSPFSAGDVVTWQDVKGRRSGRFVGIITRGRHRGMAEVALGGVLGPPKVVRVRLELIRPETRSAQARATGSR